MKMKKIIPIMLMGTIALTGCNGTKKVEFSEFKEEVAKVNRNEMPEIKKVVISGEIESSNKEYEVKNFTFTKDTKEEDLSIKEIAFVLVVEMLNGLPKSISNEEEKTNYYIGNGFRVKNDDVEMAWDKYLNITKVEGEVDDGEVDITCKWTYEK